MSKSNQNEIMELKDGKMDFIASRLMPPQYGIDLLARKRLINIMVEGINKKVTIINAPAGYGKTTILYQYYEYLTNNVETYVSWLSLDVIDTDSSVFMSHLFSSINYSVNPGVTKTSLDFHNHNSTVLLKEIIKFLENIDKQFIIVIDDYHLAENNDNNQLIENLFRYTPQNIKFVISSRHKPDIPLSYFKCQGNLNSIEIENLKFSYEESKSLIGSKLDNDSVQKVIKKTEGWPVVIQMVKLWLDKVGDQEEFKFDGDINTNELADYFSEQILSEMPEEITNILIATSILDQINGDVANHITGRDDCWSIFHSLSELDALIIYIDKKEGWFRYHNVFSQFLKSKLINLGERTINEINNKAGEWFLKNGNLELAVKHIYKSGDINKAVSIIEDSGGVRIALTEGMPKLNKLLQYFDNDTLYSSTALHLAKIWGYAKDGEVNIASDQYYDLLERIQLSDEEVKKESLFVGMMIKEVYQDKNIDQESLKKTEEMARDFSTSDHWFQGWINNLLCIMHVRRGNLKNALVIAESAKYHYTQVDSSYGQIFMLVHEANIHLLSGELDAAFGTITMAFDWAKKDFSTDFNLLAIIDVIKSTVSYERNELVEAVGTLFESLDVVESGEGWVEIYVQCYRTATQALYGLGDIDGCHEIIDRMLVLAKKRSLPRLKWVAYCLRCEILIYKGELSEAEELMCEKNINLSKEDTYITWREKHLSMVVQSRLKIYKGKSNYILNDLIKAIKESERYGRKRIVMELSIVLSLAYFDLQEKDKCAGVLKKALNIAVLNNYKRVFVREGAMMARMLRQIVRHVGVADMSQETIDFITGVLTDMNDESSDNHSNNILTEKEILVLNELALGSVNKVIARNLDVSLATVKFHLSNIYQKMGVGSRVMAVAVAKKKGLI